MTAEARWSLGGSKPFPHLIGDSCTNCLRVGIGLVSKRSPFLGAERCDEARRYYRPIPQSITSIVISFEYTTAVVESVTVSFAA